MGNRVGLERTLPLVKAAVLVAVTPSTFYMRSSSGNTSCRRNDCGRRHAWTGKTPDL